MTYQAAEFWWPLVTFHVLHLLQAFLSGVFRRVTAFDKIPTDVAHRVVSFYFAVADMAVSLYIPYVIMQLWIPVLFICML